MYLALVPGTPPWYSGWMSSRVSTVRWSRIYFTPPPFLVFLAEFQKIARINQSNIPTGWYLATRLRCSLASCELALNKRHSSIPVDTGTNQFIKIISDKFVIINKNKNFDV